MPCCRCPRPPVRSVNGWEWQDVGVVWINASTSRHHHQLYPGAEQSVYDHMCSHWVHLRLDLSSHTHLPQSVFCHTLHVSCRVPCCLSHLGRAASLSTHTLYFCLVFPTNTTLLYFAFWVWGYLGRQKAPKLVCREFLVFQNRQSRRLRAATGQVSMRWDSMKGLSLSFMPSVCPSSHTHTYLFFPLVATEGFFCWDCVLPFTLCLWRAHFYHSKFSS